MNAIAASQCTGSIEPFLDIGAVIEDAYLRGLTQSALKNDVVLKHLH